MEIWGFVRDIDISLNTRKIAITNDGRARGIFYTFQIYTHPAPFFYSSVSNFRQKKAESKEKGIFRIIYNLPSMAKKPRIWCKKFR